MQQGVDSADAPKVTEVRSVDASDVRDVDAPKSDAAPTTDPARPNTTDAPPTVGEDAAPPSGTPTPTTPDPAVGTLADALARLTPAQLADLEVTETLKTAAYVPTAPSVTTPGPAPTSSAAPSGGPALASSALKSPAPPTLSAPTTPTATPTSPLRSADTLATQAPCRTRAQASSPPIHLKVLELKGDGRARRRAATRSGRDVARHLFSVWCSAHPIHLGSCAFFFPFSCCCVQETAPAHEWVNHPRGVDIYGIWLLCM
ncbi:hypothetical protein C8J57DRAFT_135898 [Mycena rebaudengoi]|nr:hypothetical protein C8J57DRAFT_135898 [Mycena rebaudengoi]